MPFAAAEPRPLVIDCDQRHEYKVRLDDRRAPLRLHHAERAGLKRIARAEFEWLAGIVECREGNDSTDRPGFLNRQLRADLGPKRRIAAHDARSSAQGGEVMSKPRLQLGTIAVADRADIGLARFERRAAQRFLRQGLHLRSRAYWGTGREGR